MTAVPTLLARSNTGSMWHVVWSFGDEPRNSDRRTVRLACGVWTFLTDDEAVSPFNLDDDEAVCWKCVRAARLRVAWQLDNLEQIERMVSR